MKIRVCFELCTRDEAGSIADTFGLAVAIGESDREVDYQKLTASVNIEGVLRTVSLDSLVSPEDMKIITPEEYDEKYGDEADAV